MRLTSDWLRRGAGARGRKTRGQGLVEFALILPVLILLLLITIDFGRLFYSYVSLNNTVRVAANFGSLNAAALTATPPNTTGYDSTVTAESTALDATCPIGSNPPLPTYPGGSGLGATSVATMTCDFSFLTPLMDKFFGGALPITATAQFPVRAGALANIGSGTGGIVTPPPIAAFSFVTGGVGSVDASGDATGPNPYYLNFQDQSQNAQTWSWTFNNGSLFNGSPSYTADGSPPVQEFALSDPATPQTFMVTLTVTNPAGSSTVSHTVTVEPAPANPVAAFYGNPTVNPPFVVGGGPDGTPIDGTLSTQVPFINQTTGGTANSYLWDFGDGSPTSTSYAPSHTYNTLGVFKVTLSITSPTGASPFARTSYVTIGCVVPNFVNTGTNNAQSAWAAAGFNGLITYKKSSNGSTSTSPPSANKNIVAQAASSTTPSFNATGGAFDPPTGSQCTGDITLTYGP